MRKEVTMCDNCGKIIKEGYDYYPFPVDRLLTEIETKTELPYYKMRLVSDSYTDGAGSRDRDSVTLDFCRSCVSNRLIPALEKIAAKNID